MEKNILFIDNFLNDKDFSCNGKGNSLWYVSSLTSPVSNVLLIHDTDTGLTLPVEKSNISTAEVAALPFSDCVKG